MPLVTESAPHNTHRINASPQVVSSQGHEMVYAGTPPESWGKRGPGRLPSKTASWVGRGDSCCGCLVCKCPRRMGLWWETPASEAAFHVLGPGGSPSVLPHPACMGQSMQHLMPDGLSVSLNISQPTLASLWKDSASTGCPWSRVKSRALGLQAAGLTCTLQSWYRLDVPTQVLFPAPGTDFLLVGKCGTEPGLKWQP